MSTYEKVLNSEYKDFTKQLFNVIKTLDATPMTNTAENLCNSAKKMLAEIIKSTEEKETEYNTKYYELGDFTYYQNGLCVMDSEEELCVNLGAFVETIGKTETQEENKVIENDNFKDLYLINETINAMNDNNYKFKRVYNGYYVTFERLIHGAKQMLKELENPNNGQIEKLKENLKTRFEVAKNIIEKISLNNEICILLEKNMNEFKENQSFNLIDKITIDDVNENNFVEIGEKIIEFVSKDDFNKDMCGKMRILERD